MGEGFISGSTGFKSSPIIYPSYNLKYIILRFPYDITQIISNTNQRIPFLFDIRLKLKKKKKKNKNLRDQSWRKVIYPAEIF